jgi:hypothetical protein
MMKKILAAVAAWLLTSSLAFGQGALPVTLVLGGNVQVSATNPLPVTGTFSTTLSGFAPGGSFTNVTSNATSHDAALPTGTVSMVFNTGTTAVSCNFTVGAGTAVANENVIQPGSWIGITVGSNTHYSCINQAGDSASNVVVASGGAGLPTGAGGGSSGSGSNASVGATGAAVPASATYIGMLVAGNLTGVPGTANGLKVDGSAVTQPISAASLPLPTSASTAANQSTIITALGNILTQATTTASNTGAAIPAQAPTVDIGAVGISQTTPGTTNAVSIKQGTAAVVAEPCQTGTKVYKPLPAISTATTTLLMLNSGSGASVYLCHIFLNTSVAEAVSIVDGTTAGTCAAGLDALIGDTTADATHGNQLSANQGYSLGGSGYAIAATAANKDMCIVSGGTGILRGSYVTVTK